MEKNIIDQQRKRKLRFRKRRQSGDLGDELIAFPSAQKDLRGDFHDGIYEGDSVALPAGKSFPVGWVQPVLQRYRGVQWHLVDVLCLLYTGLISSLLLVFHKNVNNWMQILFINGLLSIATMELLRSASLKSENRFLGFLRVVYPAAFLGWGWNALNSLVPIFFGNFWATGLIIGADKLVFGVHPTVWFQQFHNPLLDEIMCTFYTGYYLFMPVIILSFFLCGKKKEALAVFSLATFTYFVNFILFYLLPAIGPQMVPNLDGFGQTNFSGYYIANLLRHLQENGCVMGAAFPSSHISGSIIWSLATKRYAPTWGKVLLVFTAGVAISTVYLGYHHGMDPIFGLILGISCYKVGGLFLGDRK